MYRVTYRQLRMSKSVNRNAEHSRYSTSADSRTGNDTKEMCQNSASKFFCEKLFIKKIFPLWGKSRLNTLGRRGGILCARVITHSSVMWAGVWTRCTIRPHTPSTMRTIGCPCYRPHTPIVDTPGRTWSPIDAGSSDTHALYMGTHDT